MPRLMHFILMAILLVLSACASSGRDQAAFPYDDGYSSDGGAPWLIPAPPEDDKTAIAAASPDIAIPLKGMAGLWSGGRLASALTPDIRSKMIDLTQSALSRGASGKTFKWRQDALEGTVVPQIVFAGPAGLQCREFHQTLRRGKIVETGYATACIAQDGDWRILVE